MNTLPYFLRYGIESFGIAIILAAVVLLVVLIRKRASIWKIVLGLLLLCAGGILTFYISAGIPVSFAYPMSLRTFGPATGPSLPVKNILQFIRNADTFEHVTDIRRDPNEIPETRSVADGIVSIELTAKEVIGEMADGTVFDYWTFDGTVPGPFLRVREGDTVRLTLSNDPTSLHHHSIDLHAVTGPGGGAAATIVAPGESKTITFKAQNPGLFVYHCAHPNVATHMAHGMYGLILVEPKEGLPKVDKEFYVMQGEFYSTGKLGKKGLQIFDAQAMLDGKPQYVVFNGRTGALTDGIEAKVGDTIRMYIGNGGVNLISSFHVIGEIFDRVYREGDLTSAPARDVQTTLVPAGGAAAVEFKVDYPGNYVLVDHALSRLDRGAWGVLHVTGDADPAIFQGEIQSGHGH